MLKSIGLLLFMACVTSTGLAAEGDFSAVFKSNGYLCVLRSGDLEAVIGKNAASIQIGEYKFNVNHGISPVEVKAFDLISDAPGSIVLRRTSAPYDSDGGVVQSVIDYEIRKGMPVLFVRAKLYNRDAAVPSKCFSVWSFPVLQPIMASAGGDVTLIKPWVKLPNAKDWIYYENAEKTGGLGIVTDGLEEKNRNFMANSSLKDFEETKEAYWDICVNNENEGPPYAVGEYSSINLAMFPAQSKEECATMFEKISSSDSCGLWRY